jgi:hypothetical protein
MFKENIVLRKIKLGEKIPPNYFRICEIIGNFWVKINRMIGTLSPTNK